MYGFPRTVTHEVGLGMHKKDYVSFILRIAELGNRKTDCPVGELLNRKM